MNLRLLQISDSALPIGGYTHSWGLEAAVARGLLRDAEALERWVAAWLRFALGPLEGVVVAAVCREGTSANPALLNRANELLEVSIVPPSLRQASREMGELLVALATTWDWSAAGVAALAVRGPWHHATVFGLLGGLACGSPEETLRAYLHQAALGMIGAGVRAIPAGHTHGQQVLAYLHGEIEQLACELATRDLETAGSVCPWYEVLCDAQTHLYARVFRS